MARPKKRRAAKGKAKEKADPKKRARKNPKSRAAPKVSKVRTPPKAGKAPARKAAPKAARKASQPAQKAPRKAGKRRDYRKEYQRRIARAEVLQRAAGRTPSKAVGRGHPRHDKGEVGLAELRQLRRAADLPSVGQQRERGETRPIHYELRDAARARVAEIAGVTAAPVASSSATRRSPAARKFAETFVALGLGTLHDAYTLYFSP